MEKTVKWITGAGNQVEVIVSGSNGSHDYVTKVDGQVVSNDRPCKIKHPVAVGMVGKVGIVQINWDAIKQAESDTMTKRVETQKQRELRECDEQYTRIMSRMNR